MGMFYSFEGIECCGKGTQTRLLDEYFTEKEVGHIVVREPGGTALGEAMRKLLKRPGLSYTALNEAFSGYSDFSDSDVNETRTGYTETLMFLTARAEFFHRIVSPNLDRGVTVITDRFLDSTTAYQGWGRFNGDRHVLDFIERTHHFILQGRYPDITFFLDIDYEEMCKRKARDQERDPQDLFDSLEGNFFEKVRKGFLDIEKKDSTDRVVLINGKLPPNVIFERHIKPVIDMNLYL